MSDKEKESNEDDSKHNPIPLVNTGDAETNHNIEHSKKRQKPTGKSHAKPPIYKRIFAFFANDANQTKVANIISALMVLVTAILAFYTWQVFRLTTHQTMAADSSAKAATISANAANLSAQLQKQALDSQISAKKQSDIADSAKLRRDTIFINKQKEGIDSQISAIKQTQKQFEISHSPYITVLGFGRNKADSLEIDIQNQGTQVAYFVEFECAVKAEKIDNVIKIFKTKEDFNKWLSISKNPYNTQMVFGTSGVIQEFKSMKSIADTDMNLVMQRKKKLFIRVVIYYFNTTTNKFMRYDYSAAWNPVDNLLGGVRFGYTVLKKYPE